MTTMTIDRAEVFSRPAARFDANGQLEIRASAGPGLPPFPLVRRDGVRRHESPQRGFAGGDGGGQRLEPVVRAMSGPPQSPATAALRRSG